MYVFSKVKAFVKFGVLRETKLANTVYKNIFSLKLFMKQKKTGVFRIKTNLQLRLSSLAIEKLASPRQ